MIPISLYLYINKKINIGLFSYYILFYFILSILLLRHCTCSAIVRTTTTTTSLATTLLQDHTFVRNVADKSICHKIKSLLLKNQSQKKSKNC